MHAFSSNREDHPSDASSRLDFGLSQVERPVLQAVSQRRSWFALWKVGTGKKSVQSGIDVKVVQL